MSPLFCKTLLEMTRDWAPKAEPPKPPACSQVELFQVRGRWRDPGIKTLVWGWQVYSQQLLLFSFSLSFYIYTFFAFFFNLRETWIYSFTSVQTKTEAQSRKWKSAPPLPSPASPPPPPAPAPPLQREPLPAIQHLPLWVHLHRNLSLYKCIRFFFFFF